MTPYQQWFEINVGSQSLVVNFVGTERQFAFLEFSLVYNKSDQHKTIYDSYNVEVATQKKKSLKIRNASSAYGLEMKSNMTLMMQRIILAVRKICRFCL